ncbi:hypothetical protein BRPE64_ECDS00280 (plasmid) [Caballeronia insecticola]|uniref:Uncharacterized protein n=1 Tax=Caballeronia insecticola TaxID=758793 RepID=R4X4E7_9BURK|nr:hypothetical protein BRPE64_ECDS00280 [Caballeronia insecticola]
MSFHDPFTRKILSGRYSVLGASSDQLESWFARDSAAAV